jgi:hypothetical protein
MSTLPELDMSHRRRFVWELGDYVVDQSGRKDFTERLHPRDEYGRWTNTGGSGGPLAPTWTADAVPKDQAQLEETYVRGFLMVRQEALAHGTSAFGVEDVPKAFMGQGMEHAKPEDVPPDERARCEKVAERFMNDPRMQPMFHAYGKPEIVIASGVCSSDKRGGSDPVKAGVLAQWSFGSIILYGDTTGMSEEQLVAYEKTTLPGYNATGLDPNESMIHEYGHQIDGVIGTVEDPNDPDMVGPSKTKKAFMDALTGPSQSPADRRVTMMDNAGQVSDYAVQGGPNEAFAEFYYALMDPNFNIDDYDGGAREAFQVLIDRFDADVPGWRG